MYDNHLNEDNFNPESNSLSKNKSNDELITAYIDNELEGEDKIRIEKLIQTNSDYYNKYNLELLLRQTINSRLKKVTPPPYLYKNIYDNIENYIQKNSLKLSTNNINNFTHKQLLSSKAYSQSRTNFRKYIYSIAAIFIVGIIISAFYILGLFGNNNEEYTNKDLVAISKNVYNDLESGNSEVQYFTSSALELSNLLNNKSNFKVYIPDVKEAQLIGGSLNEIDGIQFAHFVHKKNNILIYTCQTSMEEMKKYNRLQLADDLKTRLLNGNNWFPCGEGHGTHAVLWFKDDVICSSISKLDSKEVHSTLTSLK